MLGGADGCAAAAAIIPARQKMPGTRQKIPTKYLKNNQKDAPGSARSAVQHDEARLAWHQWRCGLEDVG